MRTQAAACLLAASLFCAAAAPVEPEYRQSWADYLAIKAQAKPPHPADLAGIWSRPPPGPGTLPFSFGNGLTPRPEPELKEYATTGAQLTPKYQAAYEEKLKRIAHGIEWDRLSYCLPVGMPRWLSEPWLREFIVTPAVTWLIEEQISEVRRVYTDGRGHTDPGKTPPLWEGESIGFWDGDTLVVHTTHLKAGEYQRGQPDFSFRTSTLEKIHKTASDTVEDEVTVYDPESLRAPYQAKFVYRRRTDPDLRVNFGACEEGNNAVRGPDGGTTFLLPGDPGYRDPNTLGIPPVALDSLPQ